MSRPFETVVVMYVIIDNLKRVDILVSSIKLHECMICYEHIQQSHSGQIRLNFEDGS